MIFGVQNLDNLHVTQEKKILIYRYLKDPKTVLNLFLKFPWERLDFTVFLFS